MEITAHQFEQIRIRLWAEKFIWNLPEGWSLSLDIPDWDPLYSHLVKGTAVGYLGGSVVMYKNYAWQAMVPPREDWFEGITNFNHPEGWSDERGAYVPVGAEPALNSPYWCRIARQNVYTDFDPNNDCKVAGWRDVSESLGAWFVYPAHFELPAPLSKFTQQQKTVDTTGDPDAPKHGQLKRDGGVLYWWNGRANPPAWTAVSFDAVGGTVTDFDEGAVIAANRIYRSSQKKLVELSHFYTYGKPKGNDNWDRYNASDERLVDARQIVSGYIGTQYQQYHSVLGYTVTQPWRYPYQVLYGTPWRASVWPLFDSITVADPYEDFKLEGYQSFVENCMESHEYSRGTDSNYHPLWITEWGAQLEPVPAVAPMTSDRWRCNGSQFELALKVLGSDHYDWYLDLSYPPDPQQDHRIPNAFGIFRKQGCWRRTWKYSHCFPIDVVHGVGRLMWPGELGDPPFYNKEWEEDESHHYPFADWWYSYDDPVVDEAQRDPTWEEKLALIMEEYDDAVAAHPAAFQDMYKRHSYTALNWMKTQEETVPGAVVYDYGSDRGYWMPGYEMREQIIDDIWAVLNVTRWVNLGVVELFEDSRSRDAASHPSNWITARDGGTYGDWQNPGWSVGEAQIGLSAESPGLHVLWGFSNYSRPAMSETRARINWTNPLTPEQEQQIDHVSHIVLDLEIEGRWKESTEQSDTSSEAFNYAQETEIEGDLFEGQFAWNNATINRAIAVSVDHLDTDGVGLDGLKMELIDKVSAQWTKQPPLPNSTAYSWYYEMIVVRLKQATVWGIMDPPSIELLEDYIGPDT